jgi:hypothetical protein
MQTLQHLHLATGGSIRTDAGERRTTPFQFAARPARRPLHFPALAGRGSSSTRAASSRAARRDVPHTA